VKNAEAEYRAKLGAANRRIEDLVLEVRTKDQELAAYRQDLDVRTAAAEIAVRAIDRTLRHFLGDQADQLGECSVEALGLFAAALDRMIDALEEPEDG
jgi:hypothetical protein